MRAVEFIVENLNPIIDITPNFQSYEKLYAEVVHINPANGTAYLKIVYEKLKPGSKPSEKIEASKKNSNNLLPLKVHYIKNAKVVNNKLAEAKVPSVNDQILADIKKHGGSVDEYFVRYTDMDKLGFSGKQWFGQTPDVDHPKFDIDYIGHGIGRRALWFYPAKFILDPKHTPYASEQPHVWLVKLKPDAWLQTVKTGDNKIENPPQGKERVGILRMSKPPAAIFFKHGYTIISKYYNYADRHKRHGEVKGIPEPTFFQKIRDRVL